jgi:hypothetical protein
MTMPGVGPITAIACNPLLDLGGIVYGERDKLQTERWRRSFSGVKEANIRSCLQVEDEAGAFNRRRAKHVQAWKFIMLLNDPLETSNFLFSLSHLVLLRAHTVRWMIIKS